MNFLTIFLTKPPLATSSSMTVAMDKILRELSDLKDGQRKSEEQRIIFEKRIETKLQSFHRDQEQAGPSQHRENRYNHAQQRGQDQCGSYSVCGHEHEPFAGDDFDDFDVNFPINRDAGVEELEWNIRTD